MGAPAAPHAAEGLHLNTQSPLIVIGICLAIGGNLIISGGLNGQKWVHNMNERLPAEERRPYTKWPLWWVGLVGTIGGEILNFVAFGFAGAAIVTPLGAVAVVANEVIACVFLGEQFRMRDVLGVGCTVAGSVLVVIAAPVTERELTVGDFLALASSPVFVVFMLTTVGAMAAIYRALPRKQHTHPAWGLGLCSLLGMLTVLCATALSNFLRLSASGKPQFDSAVPWLLALIMAPSAVGQMRYLNETMERFDNTTVVPVYYILFTLATVTGSAMLYQDFYEQPAAAVALFLTGCALCFGGVVLLTTGRAASHRGPDAHMQLGAVPEPDLSDDAMGGARSRADSVSRDASAPTSRRGTMLDVLEGIQLHPVSHTGLINATHTSPTLKGLPAAADLGGAPHGGAMRSRSVSILSDGRARAESVEMLPAAALKAGSAGKGDGLGRDLSIDSDDDDNSGSFV